jgi:hypothetical protein
LRRGRRLEGDERLIESLLQPIVDLGMTVQLSVVDPGAGLLDAVPLVARHEVGAPEWIATTLEGPEIVHGAPSVRPEDTVVVRLLSQTEALETKHVYGAAIFAYELVRRHAQALGKPGKILLGEKHVPRFVSAAIVTPGAGKM